MHKRGILLSFLLIFSWLGSMASHLMGGEITWECQGSGNYIFRMKLYRDCNGIPGPLSVNLNVYNHPTVTSITLNLVTQTEISPQCNSAGPTISCASAQSDPNWPNSPTPIAGAVEEFIYESAPTALTGVPPAQGWIFTYTNCCRNSTISNLNVVPPSDGFTLRAAMYPYNGQNAGPCFDSSPQFLESPKTIICTGYPFTYNHNAIDPELDSLTYSWAEPLDDYLLTTTYNPPTNPSPIPFQTGYSVNSPLPGTAANPNNVPATLNSATGEISYTSFTTGNFITVVKISAYKCGQLVAEVYREIQIVLLPCGNNSPPTVTPPFIDPNTSLYTLYADTVVAGDLVTFTFTGTDPQLLPNGNPQTLTIEASGSQFGAGFTSTTSGCLNPPCATLTPPPPVTSPGSVSTNFSWQTDCSHIAQNCNTFSNTYNFVIKTEDDFCPAPAINIATISITVLALPVMPSPELRCIAVAANGDATLTWLTPPDLGNTFNSYHIYASNNPNGPFTVIDSIFSYTQTSYTQVGANANAGPVYYYIESRSGCGGAIYQPAVDTLASMHLNVTNSGNGTAMLNWNAMHNPPLPTASGWYRIYREYPAGVWTLVDSTQSLTYIDTITICSAQINYRIEMADASGCVSVSSIDGGVFQDVIIPATPVLDSVSVSQPGNLAVIGWEPSTSTDASGYVVYMFINGSWTAIDTVYGYNNTSYINALSNAGNNAEMYCIAAFDSCGNISPLGFAQKSIHAKVELDVCSGTHELRWTKYLNMQSGVGGYEVLVSANGGPFTLLSTTTSSDTSYIHTNLTDLVNYCYVIRAFNNAVTITSSSNEVCSIAQTPQQPQFSYLKFATVKPAGEVVISCYVDIAPAISYYSIMRSESASSGYAQVGTVPYTGNQVITYTDNTALTDEKSYYYQVIAVDTCGNEGIITNIGRTMLLEAIANEDMTNSLTWNDYEQWLGNVSSYNVYRAIDGVFDPAPIANVPYTGGQNTLRDDISVYLQGEGVFSYYIEALEGAGNPYAFADTSHSNIAEALQDAKVFIPNAFVPSGLNSIFIPVNVYVNTTEYDFLIFNRWGELIFETHDPAKGWDGTYKGGKAEGGVYVYLVKYKTSRGEYIERKGSVTLLR